MQDILIGRATGPKMSAVTMDGITAKVICGTLWSRYSLAFGCPDATGVTVAFGEVTPTATTGFSVNAFNGALRMNLVDDGQAVTQQWTAFGAAGVVVTIAETFLERKE